MRISELFIFLSPLTQFIGSVVLVLLSFGSLLFLVGYLVKRYWKVLVGIGVAFAVVILLLLWQSGALL